MNNSSSMNASKLRLALEIHQAKYRTCENFCCHEKVVTMATKANLLNSVNLFTMKIKFCLKDVRDRKILHTDFF